MGQANQPESSAIQPVSMALPATAKVVEVPKSKRVFVDGVLDGQDLILELYDKEEFEKNEKEVLIKRIRIIDALGVSEEDDTTIEVDLQ